MNYQILPAVTFSGDKQIVQSNVHGGPVMVSIFQVPPCLSLLTPTSLLAYSPVLGLLVPWVGGSLSALCVLNGIR